MFRQRMSLKFHFKDKNSSTKLNRRIGRRRGTEWPLRSSDLSPLDFIYGAIEKVTFIVP